jgi:hypothetical protein
MADPQPKLGTASAQMEGVAAAMSGDTLTPMIDAVRSPPLMTAYPATTAQVSNWRVAKSLA